MRLLGWVGGGVVGARAGICLRPDGKSAKLRIALAALLASVPGVLVVAAPAVASPQKSITCGETITAPGKYVLASDCSGHGIMIDASDVRLRLAGHTMDGMGCSFSDGIAARGVAGLQIQGPGTITGYFVGVFLDSVNDSRIRKVTLSENCDDGVLASGSRDQFMQNVASFSSSGSGFQVGGTDNRYLNNSADHNDGSGIAVQPGSSGNLVKGNEVTNNRRNGIALNSSATDNTIRGNTAANNGSFDLADFNVGWATCGTATASAPPTSPASIS